MIAYFFSISQNPTGYDKVLVRNLSDTGVVWTSLPGSVYRHVIKDISPMSRQTDALTGILGHGQIDIQAFAGFRGNAPPHALSLRRRGRSTCCKGKMLTVN
jgi:hypothetical protein